MNRIKISHETPISLLEESLNFNDYQYCLVHLLEEQPQYLKHFEKCRDKNIPVLLDNSIFELGESFDSKEFAKWINILLPNEYIIPDVLENGVRTYHNASDWMNKYSNLPGKKIAVVQGRTYRELKECYLNLVELGVDKIAFSFDYSYYRSIIVHSNKLVQWMFGRISLLNQLLEENILRKDIPIHLLGCSLPQEFSFYKNLDLIESLDTSNPIVSGIKNIRYSSGGLLEKPSIKLFELINHNCSSEEKENIYFNIMSFRNLTNS